MKIKTAGFHYKIDDKTGTEYQVRAMKREIRQDCFFSSQAFTVC